MPRKDNLSPIIITYLAPLVTCATCFGTVDTREMYIGQSGNTYCGIDCARDLGDVKQ